MKERNKDITTGLVFGIVFNLFAYGLLFYLVTPQEPEIEFVGHPDITIECYSYNQFDIGRPISKIRMNVRIDDEFVNIVSLNGIDWYLVKDLTRIEPEESLKYRKFIEGLPVILETYSAGHTLTSHYFRPECVRVEELEEVVPQNNTHKFYASWHENWTNGRGY